MNQVRCELAQVLVRPRAQAVERQIEAQIGVHTNRHRAALQLQRLQWPLVSEGFALHEADAPGGIAQALCEADQLTATACSAAEFVKGIRRGSDAGNLGTHSPQTYQAMGLWPTGPIRCNSGFTVHWGRANWRRYVRTARRRIRSVDRRLREARMFARAMASKHHPILAQIVPIRRCNLAWTYCNEYDA